MEIKANGRQLLMISNMEEGDVIFTSDKGTWNVTRAQRDCAAGRHKGYLVGLEGYLGTNKNIDVDMGKIQAMVEAPRFLLTYPPLIMVMDEGMGWVIDGHHRARALLLLGQTEARCWVIEEGGAEAYRVYFNGERVLPRHLREAVYAG